MNIAIWGTGKRCKELLGNLKKCHIVAYIESQPQYCEFMGSRVLSIDEIDLSSFEVLIISAQKAADIEKKIYESYFSIWHKCVFLFLENLENISYFFYQYRLVNNIIKKEYLLSCSKWNLEVLLCDYRVMKFRNDLNCQEKELLDYAERKGVLQKLNYQFTERYLNQIYNIELAQNGMYYFRFEGRDIYFPRNWCKKKVLCYWCRCMMEHDKKSPLSVETDISNTDGVIVEIGKGIPILTIKNLSICKRAYIVTDCEEWKEALRYTFKNDMKCSIIDDPSLIIEYQISCCRVKKKSGLGECINGVMKNHNVHTFVIDVYYHENDLKKVDEMLNNSYYNQTTDGYVYYPYNFNILGRLCFRKGILICHLKNMHKAGN